VTVHPSRRKKSSENRKTVSKQRQLSTIRTVWAKGTLTRGKKKEANAASAAFWLDHTTSTAGKDARRLVEPADSTQTSLDGECSGSGGHD